MTYGLAQILAVSLMINFCTQDGAILGVKFFLNMKWDVLGNLEVSDFHCYCTLNLQKVAWKLWINCYLRFMIWQARLIALWYVLKPCKTHLNWKLKWAFLITCCLFVCLSVNFSHFIFFYRTTGLILTKLNTKHPWVKGKASLGKGDSSLFKWRTFSFYKEKIIAKKHWHWKSSESLNHGVTESI